MNICDYIIKNKIPHKVLADGKIEQLEPLNLNEKGITSLSGFVQTSALLLVGNEIEEFGNFERPYCECKFIFLNSGLYRFFFKINNISYSIYYSPKSGEFLISKETGLLVHHRTPWMKV
jgi:hypothetical protein